MNQLVRNLRNIPIQDFAKMEKIRKVSLNVPKKAYLFDAVKIIKDDKISFDIITFFSKEKDNKPKVECG